MPFQMILSTTETMPSQSVAGLSPGSPGLDTKPFRVKSMVDKMALESFFFLAKYFRLTMYVLHHQFAIYIHLPPTLYNII